MKREEEIRIIIKHLKADVVYTSQKYPNLHEDTIVKNGKLIDQYSKELKQLKLNGTDK